MIHQQDDEEEDILLTLVGAGGSVTNGRSHQEMEEFISQVLNVPTDKVCIVDIDEDGQKVMFIVYSTKGGSSSSADEMVETMNQYAGTISSAEDEEEHQEEENNKKWHCSLAEMEEEVLIEEEEAYQIWQDIPDEVRTSHLAMVSSPDGTMIQPSHNNNNDAEQNKNGEIIVVDVNKKNTTVVEEHLKRDPMLQEFDNTRRIDISHLSEEEENWMEPFVITGCSSTNQNNNNILLLQELLTRDTLMERFGDIQVRTGNRNTLVESGFDNSKPMELSKAILSFSTSNNNNSNSTTTSSEYGCIVFSPVNELSNEFQQELNPLLLEMFPSFPSLSSSSKDDNQQQQKYTLCLAGSGFGIGMHKHNEAFFWLLEGTKKWYMTKGGGLVSSSTSITGGGTNGEEEEEEQPLPPPTHPEFYSTQSTHKCIQQAGEILYVPDQWYHEIFNLSYTAGIQALPN